MQSREEDWDIMGDLTKGYLTGLLVGIPFGSFITYCLSWWYVFQAPLFGFRAVAREVKPHSFVEGFDGGNFVEKRRQPFLFKPFEGIELYFNQGGQGMDIGDASIGFASAKNHTCSPGNTRWNKGLPSYLSREAVPATPGRWVIIICLWAKKY